jgi:predicted helicase
MTPFDEALAQLEKAPEGKGLAFEKAIKWWLSNDDSWSNFFVADSIRLWRESEVAEGPDSGIDLTAKDHLERHWAIQVKNWRKEKALPQSEVDKFLSAFNTKTFHGRLLISTTESISRNALGALAGQ